MPHREIIPVAEYRHDEFRPHPAEALELLHRVAYVVSPLMNRRRWTVGVLAELSPFEHELGWNINKGAKIFLRLRSPQDQKLFLPPEIIVDIMLHEMTHNRHSPHDERFQELYHELHEDFAKLNQYKPFTGPGLALRYDAQRLRYNVIESCKTVTESPESATHDSHQRSSRHVASSHHRPSVRHEAPNRHKSSARHKSPSHSGPSTARVYSSKSLFGKVLMKYL